MGEGRIFDPKLHRFVAAHTALHSHGLQPVTFGAKDGLSMVNGTQFITGVGSFALEAGIVSAQVTDMTPTFITAYCNYERSV
jgi:histidine ammonia-lyase